MVKVAQATAEAFDKAHPKSGQVNYTETLLTRINIFRVLYVALLAMFGSPC
jgi:hypothetical protein